jgi:phosphoenolpyruvate synthase/pyruvate phosphate dikinase
MYRTNGPLSPSVPCAIGGKAAGLARMVRAGLAVPAEICLTTRLYRTALTDGKILTETEAFACPPTSEQQPLHSRLPGIRAVVRSVPARDEALDLIRRHVGALRHAGPALRGRAGGPGDVLACRRQRNLRR